MRSGHLLVLLIAAIRATATVRVDYTGDLVVRIFLDSDEDKAIFNDLEQKDLIEYWTEPNSSNSKVIFQIKREIYEDLQHLWKSKGLDWIVVFDDVQRLIELREDQIQERKQSRGNDRVFDLYNFHEYSELVSYMQEMAMNSSLATYIEIGQTYEGTDIAAVTLHAGNATEKDIFYLECGIHAREWISPSTCIWIFTTILSGYGTDPEVTALLDAFDWVIIPSINPDGYAYTWSTNRLWRKNRSVDSASPSCVGVDINRNFPPNFGGIGADADPCSDLYHGPSAISERESSAIANMLRINRRRNKIYFAIHSKEQVWMSPFGFSDTPPVDFDEMYRVMAIGAQALTATFGTPYPYGIASTTFRFTSGTSRDYAYGVEDILYAFTIEARNEDYQFMAPPSEIFPTAQEIWNGIRATTFAILSP